LVTAQKCQAILQIYRNW